MADKQKKPQKLKARQPRGFVDRSPEDIRATEEMVAKIKAVYERYGFDPVETPMFEYTDCLGKFLPDTDRPNEGVFSVQDDDEQWMSLRYDLTAPLARHVAQNINEIALPFRSYRAGWVFRNEKPGPGRFRQFMQFDADTVGAPGVQADAEMCMMMADVMEALGIARGDYVIRVNNRKFLDGLLKQIGVDEQDHKTRLTILRAIDKFDRLGWRGVEELLGEGRLDESGDFTPGAGLHPESIIDLQSVIGLGKTPYKTVGIREDGIRIDGQPREKRVIVSLGNNTQKIRDLEDEWDEGANDVFRTALRELRAMADIFDACGYREDRILIDPSVVRGLEYYTGPVYEAELLFDVINEKGETIQFGSVGGGGRYDGLVKRFTGQDVPATGFSIGVSRLMTALKNLGKLGHEKLAGPVVVCVMDKDVEALGEYQKMVQELRQAGIRAEMYQGNPKQFGKQLQYADRRGSPICIIQGSDERANGKVQLKDMIEGRRQAAAIESNEEWREMRPGQFEIDRKDLVAEVARVLKEQQAG